MRGRDTTETPTGAAEASATSHGFEFTLDRDWRIASISESAAKWSGGSAREFVGRDSRDVWPPQSPQLTEAIEGAFAGASSSLEQISLMAPGRWLKLDVAPCAQGVRIRFEDITSRVAAEKSLEPPEEAGAQTLGASSAEIALLDRLGVIVSVNGAWRAAAAVRRLDLANFGIGATYIAVAKSTLPDADVSTFQARLDDVLCGRQSQLEATYNLETPHGRELRQVQISPFRVGAVTYFIAIHEDLTERARVLASLHETSDQLLHAQEKERQRIAIELHDSMSQHLAGLVMGLAQLRRRTGADRAARALVEDMEKLTQQAVRETRVLSYLMNAAGGERTSLEASAQRFVQGFGRRAGLKTAFEAHGPVDDVGAAVHHAVFRVIQEALSNVHRHARASAVSVTLANHADRLTVRIADDGRGLRLAPDAASVDAPLGVGIAGMRARIEQLGGALEIANGPRGAVVSATVPLGAASARASQRTAQSTPPA
jgi:signal transduction histidine kinase